MFSLIKNAVSSIFSSSSLVEGGMKGIDKAIFTDEEKKDIHLKMLTLYEPFKIAQRVIAFFFCGLFGFAFVLYLGLITFHFELEASNVLDAVSEFYLGQITLAVVSFYFGGGTIAEIRRNKEVK
jgi:hypothetical protein